MPGDENAKSTNEASIKSGVHLIRSGIAIVLGALIAAWFFRPGIFTVAIASCGATMFGLGIVFWLRSGTHLERAKKRHKLLKRTALAVIVGVALVALGIGGYALAWKTTNSACQHAMSIHDLDQREARIQEIISRWRWLSWLLRKNVSANYCLSARGQLRSFREEGLCPHIAPDGITCRCGKDKWPKELGCNGPVTCWHEGEIPNRTEQLRCLPKSRFKEFGFK
ncbi:MAG: hypothetical protein ABIJ56_13265 [Pseudomonadota bacterium]